MYLGCKNNTLYKINYINACEKHFYLNKKNLCDHMNKINNKEGIICKNYYCKQFLEKNEYYDNQKEK